MATVTANTTTTVDPEQCLVLSLVGWSQYEKIIEAFPERGDLRITYVDGRITLLSPSRGHDWYGERVGQLVFTVASGLDILWEDAGSATYRVQEKDAGVEGDKTFYFGENAETMRGSVDIDLSTQPPPDLAIEVEVTHLADDALIVWGRLGVPETWRLNVNRRTLVFGIRQADGTYSPSSHSLAFPVLEPSDVLAQLRRAEELGSAAWHKQLGGWVRDVLLPRRGG